MTLQDFLFDRNDCCFLFGEMYSSREFGNIHFISSMHDLPHMMSGSLLFVTPSFWTEQFPATLLFSLAIQSNIAGFILIGQPQLHLPSAMWERLSDHQIFILTLPPSTNYQSILHLQNAGTDAALLQAKNRFRRELAELCRRPYSGLDLTILLNKRIRHPVDLVVGRDLHSLVQHNTLGILNVTAVIRENIEKIMAADGPQIYRYHHSRALVIRISNLYAFLAIPLEEPCILTELEISFIEDTIPHIALAMSKDMIPVEILSAQDIYLSILRGTLSMDSLVLREAASLLGIQHDLPRYVWILEWSASGENIAANTAAALALKINSTFSGSFTHSLASRLVVITASVQLHRDSEGPVSVLGRFLLELNKSFPTLHFQISFSKNCVDLEHLKSAYTEAKFAVIIGPKLYPEHSIHSYQNYILYHILCNAWGMPILNRIYKRYIVPLRTYDMDNHTELIQSLEQLSDHAFNIVRTAEALQIHRNTLYRRISKIGSILNCDMYATESHILLYIAMRIDRILSIFPQTENDVSWTI